MICAALAAGAEGVIEASMRDLPEPTPVEEALLQSYLFVGYPAALNAFALWRQLSGRPAPAAGPRYAARCTVASTGSCASARATWQRLRERHPQPPPRGTGRGARRALSAG